jgi:hypothetical protein
MSDNDSGEPEAPPETSTPNPRSGGARRTRDRKRARMDEHNRAVATLTEMLPSLTPHDVRVLAEIAGHIAITREAQKLRATPGTELGDYRRRTDYEGAQHD